MNNKHRCVILCRFVVVLLMSTVAGVFGCAGKPTSSEGKPIKAIVLRSRGAAIQRFWTHLNSEWSDYGSSQVVVDNTSFNRTGITFDELAASAADVVVIAGITGSTNADRKDFTENEMNAIVQYVEAGHGLVVTGGALRPPGHRALAPLLGYSTDVAGGSIYGGGGNAIIVLHKERLFNRLCSSHTSSYTTGSTLAYSVRDSNGDGRFGYPGDWEEMLTSTDARIVGYAWNGYGVWSAISYIQNSNYSAVFAGHLTNMSRSTPDDYQFVYNSIVFCGKR